MNGLTKRQAQILIHIIEMNGRVTLTELSALIGTKHRTAANDHVAALVKKGMVLPERDSLKRLVPTARGYVAAGKRPGFHETLFESLASLGLSYSARKDGLFVISEENGIEILASGSVFEVWGFVAHLQEGKV